MISEPLQETATLSQRLARQATAADLSLVRRVAQGEGEAMGELYDRYASLLLALANRIVRNLADAEDVLQETLTQVWKQARHYDPARSSVSTWLTLLTRSRAIDRLRSRQVSERKIAAVTSQGPPGEASPVGDENVLFQERRTRLQQELRNVPPKQREIIELAFFRGFTQSEIARRTGIPLGTVKTRSLAAMKKLKTALQPEIEQLL